MSPAFAEAADLLDARGLAALAMTSRGHQRATGIMARAAMERRHGLGVAQGTVADLHAFDCLPDQLAVSLRKPGARRVEAGSPLGVCCVGGHQRTLTLAQMPPACGDRWRLGVMLKRGKYVLTVDGWERENPDGTDDRKRLSWKHVWSFRWVPGRTSMGHHTVPMGACAGESCPRNTGPLVRRQCFGQLRLVRPSDD